MSNRKNFSIANSFWRTDRRRALWNYHEAVLSFPDLKEHAIFNIDLALTRGPETIGLLKTVELIKGRRKLNRACYSVLCVAHMSGSSQFGGEKSFLDALDAIGNIPLNIVIAIPENKNHRYLEELKARSCHILQFNYSWWNSTKAESAEVIRRFESVIDGFSIDYVYVNTIMLREPFTAAKNRGIPSIMHIRELPQYDEAIREIIGESAEAIVEEVVRRPDFMIFNSYETEQQFGGKRDNSKVIENTVNLEKFMSKVELGDYLRVGMISSNIRKKGVEDFFELARRSYESGDKLRYILIGPRTEIVESEYQKLKASQGLSCNVEILGYIFDSVSAVRKCDVVINLSHFQESFGRTLIEAMAAQRLVVGYDWGALSSVINNNVTGFLVPFRDIEGVRSKLNYINSDRNVFKSITDRALIEVRNRFDTSVYETRFRDFFDVVDHSFHGGAAPLINSHVDYTVVIPNYNYEAYIEERLVSVCEQTIKPKEIIFLDDCSSDRSVELAKSVLNRYEIPYRVIVNETNQGIYKQWAKGAYLATTEYLWIAEADDRCAPNFIEMLVTEKRGLDVGIFYSQSKRIDSEGSITSKNNLHHTDDISETRWLQSFTRAGDREVIDSLYYRNTIPNVSACVFKTKAVKENISHVVNMKYCGDWLLYAMILKDYDIHYESLSLNDFRRHDGSTTRKNISSEEYIWEVVSIKRYIEDNFIINKMQFDKSWLLLEKDYKLSDGRRFSETPISAEYLKQSNLDGKKRVLFITTNNGSFTGGSEMLWRESILRLYEEGVDVGIVIKRWEPAPPFYMDFDRKGIRIIHKGAEEEREILSFKADLTVISTGDQDEGVPYFRLLQDNNLKYCIVTHLVKQPEYWPVNENRVPELVNAFSASSKNLFTSKNNIKYMGIRLGCDIPRAEVFFNPTDFDIDDFVAWPSHLSSLNLAMPSRIIKIHKGHDLLIEIMKMSKWKHRNIIVNVYGNGPDEAWLREQIELHQITNIRLKGKVNDLRAVWAENHGIFMPSYMEGLPIVLVGAMLAQRVPVVTDVGGNAEIIDKGAGFVAKKPTVVDVEASLDDAYHQFEYFQEIGKSARASVLKVIPTDPVAHFNEQVLSLLDS